MPIMDGFEATEKIREIERGENRQRTPIIALTAHAIANYANKCIERGMDDYISKPIRKSSLLKMIKKWAEIPFSLLPEEKHENAPASGEPIDYNRLMQDFDGDRDIVMRILKGFIEATGKQLPVIERSINELDIDTLKRHCHSIKGGAMNLTAKNMADAAYRLEIIDESFNKEELPGLFENLKKEIANLNRYCKGLMNL